MSRFGQQPAALILKQQRWSRPAIADRINVPLSHLCGAVIGRTAPSSVLRERLPVVLGVPLSRLFTAQALASVHDDTAGPGSRERRDAEWRRTWSES